MIRRARVARLTGVLAASLAMAAGAHVIAQVEAPATRRPAQPSPVTALLTATPSQEPYTFTYFNRDIVSLQAIVLGRSPRERAQGAQRALDSLVDEHVTGPIDVQLFDDGCFIRVGSRVVLALTSLDVDNLSGETIQGVSAQAAARLQIALEEVREAHRLRTLLRSSAISLLALAIGAGALWVIGRGHRKLSGKFVAAAEKTVARSKIADLEVLNGMHLADLERRMVKTAMVGLDLIIVYATLTFVLRQFPYTRPWGESLRGFLVTTIANLGLGMLSALPGLFTVALILLITRFVVRVVGLWFHAVESGRVRARWVFPETAQPTRRLLTTLLWLFGAVVAYPYLPGSQSEAFKGVSVFVGLMVTLGSSGIVGQIMSGFTLTYSRAIRLGDFVRIGDVEGTVIHLGMLSTKVKTLRNEDVTIPNTVVVSQTTTDYSRFGDTEGVFTSTSVTIGYDAPWRQVHAMLLQAADRTAGLRSEPKPLVLQAGLEDFYVKYTLLVCLKRQTSRPFTIAALHANIQDVFNEYGVQIMSPNYVLDPAAPKVVPKKDWFAAPASVRPPDQS
jgi:small-conductance mechanosensitive channel